MWYSSFDAPVFYEDRSFDDRDLINMTRHLLEDLWNNDRSYYERFWNILDNDFRGILEEGWEIEWQKLGVDIIKRNGGAVMVVEEKQCFVVEAIRYARYLLYTEMSRFQKEQKRI